MPAESAARQNGPHTPSTRAAVRAVLHQPPKGWYVYGKRLVELPVALFLLVLTAPIILIALAVVRLTSRGPALYTQRRLGLNGKHFVLHKIRSMRHDAELQSGPQWSHADDPRVTWVGRILRRTHIDELPQLWNVITGDMSLVGPRPERPEFLPKLEEAIPHYCDRLRVRPGMTGLAQLHLPPDTDLDSVRRKLVYDLYYVRHLGLVFDFKILICTACYLVRVPLTVSSRVLGMPSAAAMERRGTKKAADNSSDSGVLLHMQSA